MRLAFLSFLTEKLQLHSKSQEVLFCGGILKRGDPHCASRLFIIFGREIAITFEITGRFGLWWHTREKRSTLFVSPFYHFWQRNCNYTRNHRKFWFVVAYSDSYSAMIALKQYNPFHPLVQKAQEWLFRLHIKFKKVQFCWVPSHVGIQLNELADEEAKEAACLPTITSKDIPHRDLKAPTKEYIKAKWQRRWSSPLLANNLKYKRIRETVQCWPSSFHQNRRYEKVLSRLRIGHCKLTHQFLLEGSSPPVCAYCQVTLTVEHILVDCQKYRQQRSKFGMQGKSLEVLLGESVEVENLMTFLKEINIFYEI